MNNRAPAITFKQQSLEKWMEIFASNDWQRSFSTDQIRDGVNFLDSSTIKEIEIRPEDIIVRYCGNNKTPYFAVVDVDNGILSARSSIPDDIKPAIGALLAMDEVIIDKQEALFNSEIESENNGKTPSPSDNDHSSNTTLCTKFLRLSFYMAGQNLCFKAYWIASEKLVFPEKLSRCGNVLSKKERDDIVKLIHLARKAGFVLLKQSKEYRITNLATAIDFCSHSLLKWHDDFTIQLDSNVQKLCKGTKNIHATFVAKEQESRNDVVDLSLKLANESYIFSENAAKKLLHSDGSPIFIDGIGAIKITKKEISLARHQQAALSKFKGEVPRYMMYSIFSHSDIAYEESQQIAEWKQSFASSPQKPFILPKILRSYQREGVLWINHLLTHEFHGLIADDMGLGKTLQVLTFISKMDPDSQTVVVCPASVVHVWKKEAEKFFPKLTVGIFSSESDLDAKGVNIWVVSYTQMRRQKSKFAEKFFQLAVLDEAQFIKNSATKVFHACSALTAKWRLALTGTPIENNLLDLWSIFRFLMPGLMGEKNKFIEICKTEDIAEKIKKQIAPFMLRRTKDTVASELPKKLEVNVSCEMTPLQQKLHKDVIHSTIKRYRTRKNQFDLKNHRFGILSALTRLRQIACDPGIVPSISATIEESGKLLVLRDILQREFAGRPKKIVIFSQFVSFLQRIKEMFAMNFPGIRSFEIIGSTKNRNLVVDEFQNTEESAVIHVSLKAGGVGITLTAAESVFLMDPWWNPSVESQAMDRVHRIGQNKNITVYRFISQNSIESGIQKLQKKKSSLFDEIIDSLKSKQQGTEFFLEHVNELLQSE